MHIRALTRADIPQIASLIISAFWNEELYLYLFPRFHEYPEDFRRYQIIRLRRQFVKPGSYGFVAVNSDKDDGEIMGFAFFQREAGPDATKDEKASQWIKDSSFNKLERHLLSWELTYHATISQSLSPTAIAQYTSSLTSSTAFYDTLTPYWYVAHLAVSPLFQRRGVGAALMHQGQNLAAHDEVIMLLESSQPALKLYKKCGFYEVWRGWNCGIRDVCLVWHGDVKGWEDREGGQEVLERIERLRGKMED